MTTGNPSSRSQADGDADPNDADVERESPHGDIRNDRDVERSRPSESAGGGNREHH
jgi:hypothetical protein